MKRLLFHGTYDQLGIDLLNGLIEDHKLDFVFNISTIASAKIKNSGILYQELDYFKAMYGRYDPVDAVLSPKVLNSLSPYLLTSLKMMDRLSFDLSYRFDDRVQMYFNHVKYWSYILDEYKIDCLLGTNVPHEIFDYILYTLCKVKGIKTVFLTQPQVIGIIQLLEDIDTDDIRLLDNSNKGHSQQRLSPFMEQYFEKITKKENRPFYVDLNKKQLNERYSPLSRFKSVVKANWRRLLKARKYLNYSLKDFSLFLYFHARCSVSAELKMHNFYNSISCLPDYSKKYIYVPLHFQPECSTSPLGGVFVFQEIMIEMLLSSLPEGIVLYVKEHPAQRIFGRSEELYKKFINNPKLVWIRKEASSMELIEHAVAVATITGTAGWEALFQGKKVLLFGSIFFQYAPGVFRVSELPECREAIKEILRSDDAVDLDALKGFLSKFEQNSIRGWFDLFWGKETDISYEENLKNILAKLRNI